MAITPEQARAELDRRKAASSQMEAPEESENLLQKVMRYGLKDPAIGLMSMGREFANLPHKLTGGRVPEFSPSDYDFGAALGVSSPDSADKLIQFGAQYGPSMAIPGVGLGRAGQAIGRIPGVGRFASRAISEAIPQAVYAAAQSPGDALRSGAEAGAVVAPFGALSEAMLSPSKKTKMMAQLLGFGGAGLLGREAMKDMGTGETIADIAGAGLGALAARGMGGTRELHQRLTEGVDMGTAESRLKAAQRLGLDYLTPAEAGVSPWAARRQGQLGRTEEGGKMLYEKGRQRQDSERRAIEHTLNQIYSPRLMDPKVKEAYTSLNEVNLPSSFPLQYENNAIVNEAKKMVENTPAYKESLKELMPDNVKLEPGQSNPHATSLVYWDHIKRAMDDMITKAERAGNNNEARIMSDTRAKMRDQMDKEFPEYKEARALYERKMVRQSLEKVFDRKEMTGSNFYQALASEKKFDELMGHLKNAPEAAQNLKDMRLLFKDLMGPPTIKTAKGGEERGMFQHRNEADFIKSLFEHIFTKGGNDEKAIRFITSKDWNRQLQELNRITDPQMRLVAASMALSRGVAQLAGQSD
jgi:hypothetical protein